MRGRVVGQGARHLQGPVRAGSCAVKADTVLADEVGRVTVVGRLLLGEVLGVMG